MDHPTDQPVSKYRRSKLLRPPRRVLAIERTVIRAPWPVDCNATVLIATSLVAIGPAAEICPPGALVVEGAGVSPPDSSKCTRTLKGVPRRWAVAQTVTTVPLRAAVSGLGRWRLEVRAGVRLDTHAHSSPYLIREQQDACAKIRSINGRAVRRIRIPVASPEEARRVVAELAAQEIDFLKIRTVQNRETYLALNEAANAHGIPLVGHVTGIPPEVVLDAGQDGVEHGFYPTLEGKTREERLAVWRKFAERGVAIVPTLVTLFEATFPSTERLRAVVEDENGQLDARRQYLSKYLVLDWREQVLEANDQRRNFLRKIWDDVVRRDLRENAEAAWRLVSPTWPYNIYPVSGFTDGTFCRELAEPA